MNKEEKEYIQWPTTSSRHGLCYFHVDSIHVCQKIKMLSTSGFNKNKKERNLEVLHGPL
jgi:hypothetical protein